MFNFEAIANELPGANEQGIAFQDKALTWDTAEDVKDVVAALEEQMVVNYLKLDGNTLGVDAAAAIGRSLQKHPEFKRALWKNMFTRRLKTEIPQALKHLGDGLILAKAQLTELDLSDNALGPNGMVGLEVLLRSPVCYSLQELRLNNCGLGIGGGQMLSKALLDCHRTSTEAGTPLKLKVFVTGRNRLENDGAKAIAKIFATVKTLEEIVMPQNFIQPDGIEALAEGFKQNPNLKILNLNDNTVKSKGAQHLADAFMMTPHLREINFGDCLLKTNGAYHFAEALQGNHIDLEVLDLSFNEIGPDGGLVLASAMQNKTNLIKLNLDGNQFGFEGRTRIQETIALCPNPNALEEMEEDQSDAEEDDEDDGEMEAEDDDEDVDDNDDIEIDDNDDTIDEELDEEDYVFAEHYNENSEDMDEENQGENAAEVTAYTTAKEFSSAQDFDGKFKEAIEEYTAAHKEDSTIIEYDVISNDGHECPVERFCLSSQPCSLRVFQAIKEKNKLKAFKGIIRNFQGDSRVMVLTFTTLNCAHLSLVSESALKLSMSLFVELVNYAVEKKQERRIINYVLKQIGLLRNEFNFQNTYNREAVLYALNETLTNKKLTSPYMRNVFQVFIDLAWTEPKEAALNSSQTNLNKEKA